MRVRLTTEVLQTSYDLLAATDPYCKWNLPDGEEVRFKISTGQCYAWHYKERAKRAPHIISISSRRIASLSTLLKTMAHEMIHLYMRQVKMYDTSDHGPVFKQLAARVCSIHGFDPKEF